jgi:hypothetical protein
VSFAGVVKIRKIIDAVWSFRFQMVGTCGVNLPGKGEKTAAQNTAHPILVGENTVGVRKIFFVILSRAKNYLLSAAKNLLCAALAFIFLYLLCKSKRVYRCKPIYICNILNISQLPLFRAIL